MFTHYVTAREFQIIHNGERIQAWRGKCSCGWTVPERGQYFTRVEDVKIEMQEHGKLNFKPEPALRR